MTGPTPESLGVQAAALIHAELAQDYWSAARIEAALEDSRATVVQVAEAVALAAAAMLTEALGSAAAERLAAGRYGRDAAAQARLLGAA